MRILVIGGTGFIGYHTVNKLLLAGHELSVLALPPLPKINLFPPEVKIHLADFTKLPDNEYKKLLIGHDSFVFAAGADDRYLPAKPSYDYFYQNNVVQTIRLIKLSIESGIKKGVILGSYFSHFNRQWPKMMLAENHPYIRSREQQELLGFKAAGQNLDLIFLELPFIFGSMPGRFPIWAPLVKYFRSPFPIFVIKGGTQVVAIETVANSIQQALLYQGKEKIFQIGSENITWKDLFTRIIKATGKSRRLWTLPIGIMKTGCHLLKFIHILKGKEGGLDFVKLVDLLTQETYFNSTDAEKELNFEIESLSKAFKDTVAACQS